MDSRTITIFVWVVHYIFLPGGILFSAIAGLTLSTYTFKATLFLLRGSLSVTGKPLPRALVASGGELLVGILFSGISVACMIGYNYYCEKKKKKEKEEQEHIML